MAQRSKFTLRKGLVVGIVCAALAVGAWVVLWTSHGTSGGGNVAQAHTVIPHLVPEAGGLHTLSQGPASATQVTPNPSIRLIPPAGSPVKAYGGVLWASASDTKIDHAFIGKVIAYCSAESARFTRVLGNFPFQNFNPLQPDVRTMRLVGEHFEKASSLREAIPGQLDALGQPQTGQTGWTAIKGLALHSNQIATKQAQLAIAGNTKGFVETVNQTTKLDNRLESLSVKYGFSKSSPCAKVF